MRRILLFYLACSLSLQGESPTTSIPLQQWVNEAIEAGGGIVSIPEGEHLLAEPLVIRDAQKIALRGVHKERCILKLAGESEAALITLLGGATVEIANLTLVGREGLSPLIHLEGPQEGTRLQAIILRDCLFHDFQGVGIEIKNADNSHIERCSFRDGDRAVVLSQCQNIHLLGNKLIRLRQAFGLQASGNCLLEGNELWHCNQGIQISACTQQHTLKNNSFTETPLGLLQPSDDLPAILEGNDNLMKGRD